VCDKHERDEGARARKACSPAVARAEVAKGESSEKVKTVPQCPSLGVSVVCLSPPFPSDLCFAPSLCAPLPLDPWLQPASQPISMLPRSALAHLLSWFYCSFDGLALRAIVPGSYEPVLDLAYMHAWKSGDAGDACMSRPIGSALNNMQAYQWGDTPPHILRALPLIGLLPFCTPCINGVADPPQVVGQLHTSHPRPRHAQRPFFKPVRRIQLQLSPAPRPPASRLGVVVAVAVALRAGPNAVGPLEFQVRWEPRALEYVRWD